MQHLVNAEMAKGLRGEIVYYTMEDPFTLGTQEVLISKVKEKPRVEGFIFFTLNQFSYSGSLHYRLMEWILGQGYELHFARERLSMKNSEELRTAFPLLFTQAYVGIRDKAHKFIQEILQP